METFINKSNESKDKTFFNGNAAGFTLVESVIAIFIITIGLLGTAAAITAAQHFTRISRNITEAKSIALAQIEQIHSLRDSAQLEFRQIANVGSVNNSGPGVDFAGFNTGFSVVSRTPGADGIFGTPDDPTAGANINPNFTQQTLIGDPLSNLKTITVTVSFMGDGGANYNITTTSYLNNDLKQN